MYRIIKPRVVVSDVPWVLLGLVAGTFGAVFAFSGSAVLRPVAAGALLGVAVFTLWPVAVLKVAPDRVRLRGPWVPDRARTARIATKDLHEIFIAPSGPEGTGITLVVGYRRQLFGGICLDSARAELPPGHDPDLLTARLRSLFPEVPVHRVRLAEALARTSSSYVVEPPRWSLRSALFGVSAVLAVYPAVAPRLGLPPGLPTGAVVALLAGSAARPALHVRPKGLRLGRRNREIAWRDVVSAGVAVAGDQVEVRVVTRSNARHARRFRHDRVDVEVLEALLRTYAPWSMPAADRPPSLDPFPPLPPTGAQPGDTGPLL